MKTPIRTLFVFVTLGFVTLGLAVEGNPNVTVVGEDEVAAVEPPQTRLSEALNFDVSYTEIYSDLLGKPPGYRTVVSEPWRSVSSTARTDIVLVIPAAQSLENTPDLVEAATKDLNIMCRIFDKQLNLSGTVNQTERTVWQVRQLLQPAVADGFPNPFRSQTHNAKAIYLDGYGVLFLMDVTFPLTAAPQDQAKKQQGDDPADQVWKKAEQELYHPRIASKKKKPSPGYDAKRVEEFTTNLIKALKHAANIRNLKPDEWVIITASGSRAGGGMPKVLIARAKKSEIDAFSKGTLEFDQFRQKVRILISPDSGRGRDPKKATGRSGSPGVGDKKTALKLP